VVPDTRRKQSDDRRKRRQRSKRVEPDQGESAGRGGSAPGQVGLGRLSAGGGQEEGCKAEAGGGAAHAPLWHAVRSDWSG
jgi:hypothetical protein